MSTTEVVVLLNGDEYPQCETCCSPMTSLHSQVYVNGDYMFSRYVIECANKHMQVLVAPVEPLTDEWRELTSVPHR